MSLKQEVLAHLKNTLSLDELVLEVPKDSKLGDFATPVAFSLAKVYKKSPIAIAQDLKLLIEKTDFFENIEIVKGFINLKINTNILDLNANKIITSSFAPSKIKKGKILLEFVSANPTGPLHIGHARGAIVGEAISSVGKFLGYEIDKEYYVNDAGNQIQLLGTSLQIAYKEYISKNKLQSYPEDYYRGWHIDDAIIEILKHHDESIFQKENFNSLCMLGKDMMLKLIKKDLESLDIKFDYFVSESVMYKQANEIMDTLKQNDATYMKDEKVWLNSSKYGDEKDRVVIKEDTLPTYLAGDITYHHNKFTRKYDKYINIWGADHHGYIARVKASIDFMGFDSKKLEILLSQLVSLLKDGKPYKMSKRKGNYVTLKDAIADIGTDALKLTFLSKKCDTHLEFDVSKLSKEDSTNPIFYIQYAHTRIHSLLSKSSFSNKNFISCVIPDNINSQSRELLLQSLLLEDVLLNAFEQREINKLIDYMYNLSSSLHSFYNQNKIIGSENELVYLKILLVVKTALHTGLSLIGIKAKETM